MIKIRRMFSSVINAIKKVDASAVKSVNGVSPDEKGNVQIDVPADDHINDLIDDKLGVIENGTY